MSLWILIPFVLFQVVHFCITIFLFLSVGGLGRQHKIIKDVTMFMAMKTDENFTQTNKVIKQITTFLSNAFTNAPQDPNKSTPVTPTPGDWKN